MADVSFTLEDLRAVLAAAKVKNVDEILGEHIENTVRKEAVAFCETKKIAKDKRDEFIAFVWEAADKLQTLVPLTKADGKNKNTSKDRYMVRVPFPKGEILMHVYMNESVSEETE